MHISSIMSRRRRRGVSTILGVLIFVGLIFTSIVPMFLVMRQADTIYIRKVMEIERAEDERDRESLEVYVFPTNPASNEELNVTVINLSEVDSRIVRVWVNESIHDVSYSVDKMSSVTLDPIAVHATSGSTFDVRVTTERGNVYFCETGLIYYGEGEWETEEFGIDVIIPHRNATQKNVWHWSNKFNVTIEKDGLTFYDGTPIVRAVSSSNKFFEVPEPGTYHIVISVWVKAYGEVPPHWDVIFDKENDSTTIFWPFGPPDIRVYAWE